MINLKTSQLRPGMKTGQGLYNTNGTCLLSKGTQLTKVYIDRLKELNIPSLYVTAVNPDLEIEPPQDIIQETTRIRAIKDVYAVFKSCHISQQIDTSLLRNTVSAIIRDLSQNKNLLFQINDIRLHDNYTFAHCVNVAALSTMLGMQINYSSQTLKELALGSLLHDIGKINIPQQILTKPSHLTEDEMAIIRRHPEDGFTILCRMNQFSSSLLHIIYEHHERFDGAGYPRCLSKAQIHEQAKIVSITDVYDALTSARPYKKAYTPAVAHSIMMNASAKQFDPDLLRLFFRNIAIYPVGMVLRLSVGYAIVRKILIGQTARPIVSLFADTLKRRLPRTEDIDLSGETKISIEYEVDDHELKDLIQTTKITPEAYLIDA